MVCGSHSDSELLEDGSDHGCVALCFNILRATCKVPAEEGQTVVCLLSSCIHM